MQDNVQAWELQSDGSYKRVVRKPDEKAVIAQSEMLAYYAPGLSPLFAP